VSLRSDVLRALGTVRDPELDEPLTELGFVERLDVAHSGQVTVALRLPTPQCAPNFAFLMAADARAAVEAVPGVRAVAVELADHYMGVEINAALARGEGFADAFPGETRGELDALRELFFRKALLGRQARTFEELLAAGKDERDLVGLLMSELPDTPDARRCVELRRRLGLPAESASPAFVDGDGRALAPDDVGSWRRRASLVRLSLETNGGLCRDLLRVRYHNVNLEEVPA
jgi:metal-sulfur cluster biosynthetic enzyme